MLEDEDVRQGVKDYANWPTIPQLYVNGQFVGGSDIIMEMFQSGELQTLLKSSQGRMRVAVRRLIVAITGASGAAYGVQLLRRLRERARRRDPPAAVAQRACLTPTRSWT